MVVGPSDYKVPMKGKEKTLHAQLLKKYIVREDFPVGNAVPTVQDDHWQNIPSGVASVEDYEPDANVHGTDNPSGDIPSVEDLPEIGAWGPKESVTDLKFGCQPNRFGTYSHLRLNTVTSLPTILVI